MPESKKPWVIPPITLGLIGLIIVLYVLIAQGIGFRLITSPAVVQDRFSNCLFEILLLWTIGCLIAGWRQVRRREPFKEKARVWPPVLVALLLGLAMITTRIWEVYNLLNSQGSIARDYARKSTLLTIVIGIGSLLWMWSHLREWATPRRNNLCEECGYDLRGNTSGRCPECGRLFLSGRTSELALSTRQYPELNFFESAEQRDCAWQLIQRENRRARRFKWSYLLGCIVVFCALGKAVQYIGDWAIWVAIGVVFCIGFFLVDRRDRQHLREQIRRKLIEVGIPVCLDCGRDLRDETATACQSCRGRVEMQGQTKQPG